MFDNLLNIQNTLYMLISFVVLFFGTIINFAFMGLLNKKSQIISNIITISVLTSSIILQLPVLAEFLFTNNADAISILNGNIAFGALETAFCILTQTTILFAFLISLKHLKQLRFKQHYFNTLYLCCALSANILFSSKGFLPFMLSLEAISACTLFIILAFKNREIFYSAYKFILFSLGSCALMILSYGVLNIADTKNTVILTIFSTLFLSSVIFKGAFAFIFTRDGQGFLKYNFPSFVFLNTVIFTIYCSIFAKIFNDVMPLAPVTRAFFIILLIIGLPFIALKIPRAKTYSSFLFSLNSLNFCIITLGFFIGTAAVNKASIFLLTNTVISTLALLCAFAIFDINKKDCFKLKCFESIYYKNPFYATFLSITLFISAGFIPSGIIAARYQMSLALFQTGLWSTLANAFMLISYIILAYAVIKFVNIIYKKPHRGDNFEKIALKKRMKLNYSILSLLVILSITLCFISL